MKVQAPVHVVMDNLVVLHRQHFHSLLCRILAILYKTLVSFLAFEVGVAIEVYPFLQSIKSRTVDQLLDGLTFIIALFIDFSLVVFDADCFIGDRDVAQARNCRFIQPLSPDQISLSSVFFYMPPPSLLHDLPN